MQPGAAQAQPTPPQGSAVLGSHLMTLQQLEDSEPANPQQFLEIMWPHLTQHQKILIQAYLTHPAPAAPDTAVGGPAETPPNKSIGLPPTGGAPLNVK